MNRSVLAVSLVAMVALAGCSAIQGGGTDDPETTPPGDRVALADDDAGAAAVNQTLRIAVDDATNATELTEIGATYPRDQFAVQSAQHGEIVLGVDTNGDGELDREFNGSHVSGVNNNAYSFDITLDTDYTLADGDVVVVGYPAVDNPDEPGEYEVEVRLNDEQNATGTVSID